MPEAHPYHIVSEPSCSFTALTTDDLGQSVAAGRADGSVTAWNTRNWKAIRTIEAPGRSCDDAETNPSPLKTEFSVLALGFLPNASCWVHSRGIGVTVYEVDGSPTRHFASAGIGFCNAAAFTLEGSADTVQQFVALPVKDSPFAIRIADFDGDRNWNFEAHKDDGMGMKLRVLSSPDPKSARLYVSCESGCLLILGFSPENGVTLSEEVKVSEEPLLTLAVHETAGWIAGGPGKEVYFGELGKPLSQIALPTAGVSSISIRNDGKLFAVGSWTGHVYVYGTAKRKLLAVLQLHSDCVDALKWGRTGELLVAARDGKVSFWKLY